MPLHAQSASRLDLALRPTMPLPNHKPSHMFSTKRVRGGLIHRIGGASYDDYITKYAVYVMIV